jgi:hypothetical protein
MRSILPLLSVFLIAASAPAQPTFTQVRVDPPSVRLVGPGAGHSLLIDGTSSEGVILDLTHDTSYQSDNPKIATVSPGGIINAVSDGTTTIRISTAGKSLTAAVEVRGSATPRRFNFENDIMPLLSRHGCNSSGCHGKAEGQNGFRMSVFGFDPNFDYNALVKEARGRRVLVSAPAESLVLKKPSGQMAHGGGVRLPPGSRDYETVRGWIAAGVPFGSSADPIVAAVRVDPHERILPIHGRQQLRVVARYSDGREADVTALARFQSNNEGLASVDPTGQVTAGQLPGDVAVMASFMGHVDVFRALVPRAEKIASYPSIPENNFIDKPVLAKLRKLNLLPSDVCEDAEYLRRVYLDVIGTLPTADEARRFLADKRPDRRARLVDELLQRPEYADFWALKWADLLHVERSILGHKRAYAYYHWIRDSLATNKPYDRFVREILTADGPLSEVPQAAFHRVVAKPGEAASSMSQVFLGIRIACAECHHHPFDRWSQTDYYGMKAFFEQVSIRSSPRGEFLVAEGDPAAKHPRTGETIFVHALGVPMPAKSPEGDRRKLLADWMTAADNPWFARNLGNRLWAHFLGRGLVEPVDDVRGTNPPSNPELLDALGKHLVDNKYDVKQLIRAICASRTYQLSATPNTTNESDEQNYSRARLKRASAEVLLDMVCQATGRGEKFDGIPAGARAIQLWDSKVNHYFLKAFGRPERVTACECERVGEPSVAQVLHLLNAPEIHGKISHADGRVARMVRQLSDDRALIDELYLTFYSRLPNEKERTVTLEYLGKRKDARQKAAEDIAWSLLNSLEFVFNH